MAKRQLGFSEGSELLPDAVWVPGHTQITDAEVRKNILLLERVKRLPTRPGRLADFLRQCLTVEHMKDIKAAARVLAERAKRAGYGPQRVPEVLKQLLDEAGE